MERPTRLSDRPSVVVDVECRLCPRRGRYRLARLAAELGPETALEGVLAALAADCHLNDRHAKPRAHEARCGIRFDGDLFFSIEGHNGMSTSAADGPSARRWSSRARRATARSRRSSPPPPRCPAA